MARLPATLRAWRRLYGELLHPGNLAIDVGAHVGTRTRALRGAGIRVIALEPQALFAAWRRRTLPRDVVLIEAAAGARAATAELAVSSRHPTVSSLQPDFVAGASDAPGFDHVRWDRRERVAVVTLDDVIAEHGAPAYVKIDVEGFEVEVLAGLSRPVPLISVEYLPGFPALTAAVLDRLEALGDYRFCPVVGERSGLLWDDWRDGDAVRSWLATLPADGPSGDLFARVVQSPGRVPAAGVRHVRARARRDR